MVRRVPARTFIAAMIGVALAACSARYLVSGTVVNPDGDAVPDALVAPRIKCGGDPTPSAYSTVSGVDGAYRSVFSYGSDHTVVEFTKADYQRKCVELASLWRRDCGSVDGGADRCAKIDVTLTPATAKQPGVDAPSQSPPADAPTKPPPADEPATSHPVPMTD